jgi:hypothetical protein
MALTLDGTNGIVSSGSITTQSATGVIFSDSSSLPAASSPYVLKNRIINGDMRIDQRYAGAAYTNLGGNFYVLDRWSTFEAGVASGKFTVQQNAGAVTPPVGFSNYIGITSQSAYSVAAGDIQSLRQTIEGFNTADLAWGTANAKTVTISFWVRSSLTGTFGGVLSNGAINYSYPFTYTISAANTWEYETVTIAGPTAGTWNTTNGSGITLQFVIGTGTTYQGAAGSWSANGYYGVTGAVNVTGTNGATLYITGVQLEVGSTATPFERRLYGQELNNCKRYYEKSYDYSVVPATTTNVGRWNAGGNATGQTTGYVSGGHVVFQVEKRAIPTVTSYDASGNSGKCTRFTLGGADDNNQNVVVADVAMNGWFPFADTGGTNNSGCGVHWVASAEL